MNGDASTRELSTDEQPNVLLLVIDACRADAVAPYADGVRTPNIATLASEGTVFERAISPAPWTLPSVTSLLSGLYPHEHGATSRGFESDCPTITRDLTEKGYHSVHLSPKTWIGDWLPQGAGFDTVVEFTGPRHRYFDKGADVRQLSEGVSRGSEWYTTVGKRAVASSSPLYSLANAVAFKLDEATGDIWLDDVRASERAAKAANEQFEAVGKENSPFFMYAHLMDPHLPFYVPEPFQTDIRPPGCMTATEEQEYMQTLMDDIWDVRLGNRQLSDDERTYIQARYQDEVAYVDHVVGRILDSLERHGLADDALVVLTADHGEHLGERTDGRTLLDHQTSIRLPVLRTPLILRYPGQFESDERDDLVQPHYIAETVRALCGLEYDRTRSLLSTDTDARREIQLAEYAGVVPSHPPEHSEDDRLHYSRRTAIADEWKLDIVAGERRVRHIDWTTNTTTAVIPDDIPEQTWEKLTSALERSITEEEGIQTLPDDVERNLADLGYL